MLALSRTVTMRLAIADLTTVGQSVDESAGEPSALNRGRFEERLSFSFLHLISIQSAKSHTETHEP